MPLTPLSALLQAGGVFHDVEGETKHDVLRAFVARLPLDDERDRAALLRALEDRETSGSTAIGGGIAIPHARGPLALATGLSFVALCVLERPVDFGAADRLPVHALFLIVDSGAPGHVATLAQIGGLMRDAALCGMLRERSPAPEILDRIRMLERAWR